MNPIKHFLKKDIKSKNTQYLNITRDKSKNFITPKESDTLHNTNILFAPTPNTDYVAKKRFDDEKFNPIQKKPKNNIEIDTRKKFYDTVDHYPNIIPALNNTTKLKTFIFQTEPLIDVDADGAQGMKVGGSGPMGKNYHIIANVYKTPKRTASVIFHELRHIQQQKGEVTIDKSKSSFYQTNDEWKNNPGEIDAEAYSKQKVAEGERLARQPFNYAQLMIDKTSKNMPFVKETTVPAVDYPQEYNSFIGKKTVAMHPDKFLESAKAEAARSESRKGNFRNAAQLYNMSIDEFSGGSWNPKEDAYIDRETGKPMREGWKHTSRVERVKEGLAAGKNIPGLFLEQDIQGNPVGHEGRHRAVAARELGMTEVPVHILTNRPFTPGKTFMSGQWDMSHEVKVEDTIPGQFEGKASNPTEDNQSTNRRTGWQGNIDKRTIQNKDYRHILYTGRSQLSLQSLQPGIEIGRETHKDLDQFFRIEQGTGKAIIGKQNITLHNGSAFIVPAGTPHNVINNSHKALQLYTVYSKPAHPAGIIEHTKADEKILEDHHSKNADFAGYYKCPKCGKQVHIRDGDYCPHCKKRIGFSIRIG